MLGVLLIGLSLFAVAQTIREIVLWETGQRAYAEEHPHELPFTFAGHTFTLRDDQPFTTPSSEAEVDGTVQPLMDARPLGPPTRARVRPGRGPDLGRYHLWYDATVFRNKGTGERTLWLARRVQATDAVPPRFEVTVVDEQGHQRTRVLPAWRLGTEFRMFRATQFVRDGTWSTMPLSLGSVIGFFPVLLLLFPIGSFVLGLLLVRRGAHAPLRAPAG